LKFKPNTNTHAGALVTDMPEDKESTHDSRTLVGDLSTVH